MSLTPQSKTMKEGRAKRRWAVLAAVLAVLVGTVIFVRAHERGFLSSRNRVEHEHGVRLPASARSFLCVGDAWHGFLDRGATAVFQMDRSDMPAFMAQFSRLPAGDTRFVSGYGGPPGGWGSPKEAIRCASSVGDWMVVAVFEVSPSTVGIQMYTDWN